MKPMLKVLMAAVVMIMTTVASPSAGVALASGNAIAAKTCQADYVLLGFSNRGACTSFFARGGGVEPPPTGPAALNVVGTVYNSCIAAGTTCFVGIYGTGLQPGSTVSLFEPDVCCTLTFPVASNGTLTVEGIFICGGFATRSNTFVATGTAADGTKITSLPLVLPTGNYCVQV